MAGRNWEKALFDPDLAGRLGLPLTRLNGDTPPPRRPAAEERDARPAGATRPEAAPSANHKAMAASGDTKASCSVGTSEGLRSLACSLDPTLG
jgi:hypothetical protein